MKASDIYTPPQTRDYLRTGDRFRCIGNEYILAASGQKMVVAINLETGARMTDAVQCGDIYRLTRDEAQDVTVRYDIEMTRWVA